MNSFATQVQVEETIPDCPFCEQPLTGESRNGLHPACDEAFAAELEEAFPLDADIQIEPSEDVLPLDDAETLEFEIAQLLRR